MNNKISLTLITLLVGLSTSVSAASLDVHGDIKVNGKVVIDAQGNVINNNNKESIDFSEYYKGKEGIYKFKNRNNNLSSYEISYDKDGNDYKEIDLVNGVVMFSLERTEYTESSVKVTEYNGWNQSNPVTTVRKHESIVASSYPKMAFGNLYSKLESYTKIILETTLPTVNQNDITYETDVYQMSPISKTVFQLDSETLTDCLVVTLSSPWSDQGRTYCKGYGLVQFGSYTLTEID